MKNLSLWFAVITAMTLFEAIFIVIFQQPIGLFGSWVSVSAIALAIYSVFLGTYLFKNRKSGIETGLLIVTLVIVAITWLSFIYDFIVSVITGSFIQLVPSFVLMIYGIFTLYMWIVVFYFVKYAT